MNIYPLWWHWHWLQPSIDEGHCDWLGQEVPNHYNVQFLGGIIIINAGRGHRYVGSCVMEQANSTPQSSVLCWLVQESEERRRMSCMRRGDIGVQN